MGRLIFGLLAFSLGSLIAIWVAYNVLIQRQAEFQPNPCGFIFMLALLIGGAQSIHKGWTDNQKATRPKRKTRRPAYDDDDDDRPRQRRRNDDDDDDRPRQRRRNDDDDDDDRPRRRRRDDDDDDDDNQPWRRGRNDDR